MAEETFTRSQIARAVELLNEQHQHQALADGFWERVIPKPWPPGIARAVEEHDHPGPRPDPQPVDVADMNMAEYVKHRDRLGITESNGLLGTELRPWQKTKSTNRSTQ